jgi:hypothetical protein
LFEAIQRNVQDASGVKPKYPETQFGNGIGGRTQARLKVMHKKLYFIVLGREYQDEKQ